jgi:hypothetical protein
MTSTFDSLTSTLSAEMIDPFFARWDKNPRTDELTSPKRYRVSKRNTQPISEKKAPGP